MNEILKKYIIQETKPYCNLKNIEEITDLFLDTLDYEIDDEELEGVGNRLSYALMHLATEKLDAGTMSLLLPPINKTEAYARKVLYITQKKNYLELRGNTGGFAPVLKAIGLSPRTIQSAYDLRNLEAHSCKDWTARQYYEKITDILVACLLITNAQSSNLRKIIYAGVNTNNESGNNSGNIDEYIKNVLKTYQAKIKNIVQLDSEENISMNDIYACENIEGTNKKIARKGTVRDLINSVVEKRIILWGDAGAGKTTTLEYITYMDAREYQNNKKGSIPVLIYLGTTTNEHMSLCDYILDKLQIEESELKKLLSNGKINLYFDGFNEIPFIERNMLKTKRRRELTDFLINYPRTFIVLTNRPQDGKEFSDIPVFNLLEMNNQQINDFIQKNTSSEDTCKLVNEAIKNDPNLKAMVKRPLILKSLLFIAKTTGEIPKREGLIIGGFLKALFSREKQEKYDEYLDEQKINLILRRIGYESLEKYKTNSGISEEIILDIINRCQKDYNFTYDNFYTLEIIIHLGIMDKKDGLYMFSHQSFQDYYASQEELAIMGL